MGSGAIVPDTSMKSALYLLYSDCVKGTLLCSGPSRENGGGSVVHGDFKKE